MLNFLKTQPVEKPDRPFVSYNASGFNLVQVQIFKTHLQDAPDSL